MDLLVTRVIMILELLIILILVLYVRSQNQICNDRVKDASRPSIVPTIPGIPGSPVLEIEKKGVSPRNLTD